MSRSATRSGTRGPDVLPLESQHGVKIVDPIETARFNLYTSGPVSPTPASPDAFRFPVSTAVTVETEAIQTPYQLNLWIRDEAGEQVATVDQVTPVDLPRNAYSLELSSTPVKLYLRVESPVSVTPAEHGLEIEFPEETTVTIGTRSLHNQPAQTITVSDDPADLADALSSFGSSLKTTSPERSFPTLRGHPPLVERGNELSIPEPSTRSTDIRIEVPAQYRYLFPVATLAFYLDADVAIGPFPRLVADGTEYSLDGPDGFESRVADILRQVFLLDCVVRTTGLYQVELSTASEVEPILDDHLDVPLEELYEAPIAERVNAYLSIPTAALEPHLPAWLLTADVPPEASNLPLLPHLVNDLAIIRCRSFDQDGAELGSDGESEELDAFYRSAATANPDWPPGPKAQSADGLVRGAAGTRSTVEQPQDEPLPSSVTEVEENESINHAWFGDDLPLNASRPTLASYERALARQREEATSNRIDVHVVVNDEEMLEEASVGDIYGTRDLLSFDITIHEYLSRAELAELLGTRIDFLHFVGHVTAEGMQCADGYLDVESLDDVGPAAFFINACRSYRQGRLLVEKGAISGIVTLERVLNTSATDVGRSIARLLNTGWSLSSALSVVQDEFIAGHYYMVMGDGTATMAQYETGAPIVASLGAAQSTEMGPGYNVLTSGAEKPNEERYVLELYIYPNSRRGLGALYAPYIGDNQIQYLNSGLLDKFVVTAEELQEFLGKGSFPIRISNHGFYWSRNVTQDQLRSLDMGPPHSFQ